MNLLLRDIWPVFSATGVIVKCILPLLILALMLGNLVMFCFEVQEGLEAVSALRNLLTLPISFVSSWTALINIYFTDIPKKLSSAQYLRGGLDQNRGVNIHSHLIDSCTIYNHFCWCGYGLIQQELISSVCSLSALVHCLSACSFSVTCNDRLIKVCTAVYSWKWDTKNASFH